jgi:hypothetical protein
MAAMIKMFTLTATGLIAAAPTPAVADFYIELANGRYLVLPDVLVLFMGAVALLTLIAGIVGSMSSKSQGTDLP